MSELRKYGVQTTIIFPVIAAGETDLAASGDWTPATGDTKVSKDGGDVANTTNNPSAVGGTGSKLWSLTLTAAEMQAATVTVQIDDDAVEDQVIMIDTYGHASAQHAFDFDQPGPGGSGADTVTITITNTDTAMAVADADVWVTSDSAGTTIVAGTSQTDSSGQVVFLLDDGSTYYLWAQKNGVVSIQGESFVAEADA